MAGFNREELSRRSKAELLDYIEQQSDQLGRFETRFRGRAPPIGTLTTQLIRYTLRRQIGSSCHAYTCIYVHVHATWCVNTHTHTHIDVVRAYKSVLKEKEALEQSIRALSGHAGLTEGEKSDGGGEEERERGGGEVRPSEGVESEGDRKTDESETDEGNASEVRMSPVAKETKVISNMRSRKNLTSFPLSHCPVFDVKDCTVRRPGNEHGLHYEWHVVHIDWRQLSDYSSPPFSLPRNQVSRL